MPPKPGFESALPFAERDRRWVEINAAAEAAGFDALIIAGNAYPGHKGGLRYVASYRLNHRYAYVVMAPQREPVLIAPASLEYGDRSPWISDLRFTQHPAGALVAALRELPRLQRIGIVGRDEIMRVGDWTFVSSQLAGIHIEDASKLFEHVRGLKSPLEIAGVQAAAEIADRCFERLLEIITPGVTERALGAEMYKEAALLGGEEFFFLTMHGVRSSGGLRVVQGAPRDRIVGPTDQLVFSLEFVGPLGYWIEFARPVFPGEPTELHTRLNSAAFRGLEAFERKAIPGALPSAVQSSIAAAVQASAGHATDWSGHGIGLDVIEHPRVGFDPALPDKQSPIGVERPLAENMVLAIHPLVVDPGQQDMAYVADTFVIEAGGPRRLSAIPLALYTPTFRP